MNGSRKILTIIQARMSSTRLPGKVMMTVLGRPLLSLMSERVMNSKLCGKVVVATSNLIEDDTIAELCRREDIECYRGSLNDLLDRHYKAAINYDADIVLKIPSDCPLIDYRIIDKTVDFFLSGGYDYVSNLHPASYPDGNDVEVFSFASLHKAWNESKEQIEREHTTPYILNSSTKFNIGSIEWETGLNYSETLRFTLDYVEDYNFIKSVFEELYPADPLFSLYDIIRLLEEKPELKLINSVHNGKFWHRNCINDNKTLQKTYLRTA